MQATSYKGSESTRKKVAEQIAKKYGDEEAKNYNPELNVRTYRSWLEEGFKVKKGEKAIRSVTFIEVKNKSGEVIKKYPKTVNLFYIKQVEKITT